MSFIEFRDFENIDPFGYSIIPKSIIPLHLLKKLHTKKDKIISEFIKHNGVDEPYGYPIKTWYDESKFKTQVSVSQDWSEEAKFWDLIFENFDDEDFEIARRFFDWDEQVKAIPEGFLDKEDFSNYHCMCDCIMYFVHLLNIFEPNKRHISGICSIGIKRDALGRENRTEAIAAINKIVKRELKWKGDVGFNDMVRSNSLIDICVISQPNLEQNSTSKGLAFETEICRILENDGYSVSLTKNSGDYGADIIAKKDGIIFSIQCKNSIKSTNLKAVQEVIGSKIRYNADVCCVCSASEFAASAVILASDNDVVLACPENIIENLEKFVKLHFS